MRTLAYIYDGLQRLIGAQESPGTAYAYQYDLAGNRTQMAANGATTQQHTYDAANQVVGWTYDAAGNLTGDGTATNSYDALGRLTAGNVGAQGSTYSYNGDGTLVGQATGGVTTAYAQDLAGGQSQVLAIATGSGAGAVTTDQLWGADRLASLNPATGARAWYGYDGQGSARQLLNDAGHVTASANYDPYGGPEGAALPSPFGYTGELTDPATGSQYLRARWYRPGQGSLLGVDPLLDSTGQPYSYASDNPANGSDPSGQCFETQGSLLLVYKQVANPGPCTPDDWEKLGGAESTDSYWITDAGKADLASLEAKGAVTQDEAALLAEQQDVAYNNSPAVQAELKAEEASGDAEIANAARVEETLLAENTSTIEMTPAPPLVLGRIILSVALVAYIGLTCVSGSQNILTGSSAPLGDFGPQYRNQPTPVDTPTPTASPTGTPTATATPTATPVPPPIFYVYKARTRTIWRNDANAIRNGGYPSLLHYDPDESRNNKRRRTACSTARKRQLGVMPGVATCDEYPFASTQEGGLVNGKVARTVLAPYGEQQTQAGDLGSFVKKNNLVLGKPIPCSTRAVMVDSDKSTPHFGAHRATCIKLVLRTC